MVTYYVFFHHDKGTGSIKLDVKNDCLTESVYNDMMHYIKSTLSVTGVVIANIIKFEKEGETK